MKVVPWLAILTIGVPLAIAQQDLGNSKLPVATQWTLDAAGPTQRSAIRSVVLLYCPLTNKKGTGFVLKNGLIVTNNHVVEGCTVERLQGVTSGGEAVVFRKMATDPDVDLAALRPTEALKGGLELADAKDPDLGMAVSTWGYPLIYNGPAPLLSVGYVAGFSEDVSNGKRVKHLVINGAFNPGNSGGPLFKANDNKVIGVVVAKFHLYPPIVRNAIEALARNKTGVVYTATDPQGNQKSFAESEIVAMVLDQYYTFTQVMIGEAISVSEVRAFLKAHEMELR